MVKEMEITKVSIRTRLIADLKVIMNNPRDYDFSPRAEINGTTLLIKNDDDETSTTSFELDSEMMQIAERDRMVELRIKFNVEGMHGVLLHKTPNPKDGPKSKKLAQPSWKTILPLDL
ncbi:MAG: hypothetical protein OR994_01135 [Candidatus Poseidoniales archaeon]|jgi:hypothetical protein|nr:hypothetical protein [Candidatus Poseidoniales archaeon]|tara:strand:+ start:639 stop:992 length:354 start_codon:yes stop_codon:yes gene_type:complete